MPLYSKKTLEHLKSPRNVGTIPNATATGDAGNPHTSNYIKMWVKTGGSKIRDIKFKAYGCVPAIAAASAITEMAKGRKVSDAMKINDQDVLTALDGLPPERKFCAKMAVEALRNTLAKIA